MSQSRRDFLQLLGTVAVTAPFAGSLNLIPIAENVGWFRLEKYQQYGRAVYTLNCFGATPGSDVYVLDYGRFTYVHVPPPGAIPVGEYVTVFEQVLSHSVEILLRDLAEHGVNLITVPPIDRTSMAEEHRLIKVVLPGSIVFMRHPEIDYEPA